MVREEIIKLSFSNIYNDIINKKEKISLIGLGYVGMPIAVSFSRKVDVIGFDVNQAKINLYKSGIDPTKEVGDEAIATCTVDFTSDETRLREAKFHIVAVPTPVNAKTKQILPLQEEVVHIPSRSYSLCLLNMALLF
jgi:UDP-N-acetyl-D-galactosamine dehydrogenase